MKYLALALGISIACADDVYAHPHDDIEQQALVSIGIDRATVEFRIVPSFDEGPAIFAHIDRDSDGVISPEEASSFAASVMAQADLLVNGSRVELQNTDVEMPEGPQIWSGVGVIAIRAKASFPQLSGRDSEIQFQVSYEELSHEWFIQPFFFADLNATHTMDQLVRSLGGQSVTITFSSTNQ